MTFHVDHDPAPRALYINTWQVTLSTEPTGVYSSCLLITFNSLTILTAALQIRLPCRGMVKQEVERLTPCDSWLELAETMKWCIVSGVSILL